MCCRNVKRLAIIKKWDSMRCRPGSPHYLASTPWPSISRIRCLLSGSWAQSDSTHCMLSTSQLHEIQLQMLIFFLFLSGRSSTCLEIRPLANQSPFQDKVVPLLSPPPRCSIEHEAQPNTCSLVTAFFTLQPLQLAGLFAALREAADLCPHNPFFLIIESIHGSHF